MHPDGPNPCKLQSGPKAGHIGLSLPLVLIHDAGGTTTGFQCLETLHRDVWAIHNPHFWNQEPWEGGIDEITHHYIALLVQAGIKGAIILGGWSLGGFLSLGMANVLAREPSFGIQVAGLLMMDSPHAIPWSESPQPWISAPLLEHATPKLQRALDYFKVLLQKWPGPSWDGPAYEDADVHFSAGDTQFTVGYGTVIYKSLESDWYIEKIPQGLSSPYATKTPFQERVLPPPGVLLRCTEKVPTVDGGDTLCRIDMHRGSPLLGWESYPAFFKAVMEVRKNHFTLFDKNDTAQMKDLSEKIRLGLEILDTIEIDDF